MPEQKRPRILIVDDDELFLAAMQRQLHSRFEVTTATGGKEAIRLVTSHGPYAVVVSDLRMPGMDGVTLLYLIRRIAPDSVRVLLSGKADVESASLAVNEGNIFRFLIKPCPTGIFNGSESMTPGVVDTAKRSPHPPTDDTNTGPVVSFSRSSIAAHWNDSTYRGILELAEACDVPDRWSCRTGVCHNRESGLISGAVVYKPEPLDNPADGNLLICCSQPLRDVAIDS